MTYLMNRRTFLSAAGLAGLALIGGCSNGSGSAPSASGSAASGTIRVGTLATEDILPYWVASENGLFSKEGLDVEIVPFQSAKELIAGVVSGEAKLAMTDIMVTASMVANGADVQMQWVTLGSDATQGRFGIMAGPGSTAKSLTDLAGVKIGVGYNTILEYVMDKLMEAAGVPADQVQVEPLDALPMRYQMMAEGKVAAAALPGTLLALGEASGFRLIADDTTGDNLSQSVMIAHSSLTSDEAGKKQLDALKSVWDTAVGMINGDPESYRQTLVKNATLPDEIAATYPISTYPTAKLPTRAMVDPVLSWMKDKGYLDKPLSYDETTGVLNA